MLCSDNLLILTVPTLITHISVHISINKLSIVYRTGETATVIVEEPNTLLSVTPYCYVPSAIHFLQNYLKPELQQIARKAIVTCNCHSRMMDQIVKAFMAKTEEAINAFYAFKFDTEVKSDFLHVKFQNQPDLSVHFESSISSLFVTLEGLNQSKINLILTDKEYNLGDIPYNQCFWLVKKLNKEFSDIGGYKNVEMETPKLVFLLGEITEKVIDVIKKYKQPITKPII